MSLADMSDPLDDESLKAAASSRPHEDEDERENDLAARLDDEQQEQEPKTESKIDQLGEKDTDSVRYSSKHRRLEYFRNGISADCEVHVQSTCNDADIQSGNVCYRKFACHRIFLATASEKLEQDIYQNKQWNGVLQINGVSPESVEIFLEFVYTFDVTSPNVKLRLIGDIFILACAYNMPELLVKFSDQLKGKDWPLEGIFPAFDLAFRHNIGELEHACLEKILEKASELVQEPSIMNLQIYALNYVIQHWLVTEALTSEELVHLLQQYQAANDITFGNSQKFPHFTKIIKYFPNILLDAEGIISKY